MVAGRGVGGSSEEKGKRGGPQRYLDLPRPFPHLPTHALRSLLAQRGYPE